MEAENKRLIALLNHRGFYSLQKMFGDKWRARAYSEKRGYKEAKRATRDEVVCVCLQHLDLGDFHD